jgi:hypothetical protein
LIRHEEPKEVEVVTEPEFVESAPLSLAAYEG